MIAGEEAESRKGFFERCEDLSMLRIGWRLQRGPDCIGGWNQHWIDAPFSSKRERKKCGYRCRSVSTLCGGRWKSVSLMTSVCSEVRCKIWEKEGTCEVGESREGWRHRS